MIIDAIPTKRGEIIENLYIDNKKINPFEPFLCMEDNEQYKRYEIEINNNNIKIPVYIKPSDIKKLRGE